MIPTLIRIFPGYVFHVWLFMLMLAVEKTLTMNVDAGCLISPPICESLSDVYWTSSEYVNSAKIPVGTMSRRIFYDRKAEWTWIRLIFSFLLGIFKLPAMIQGKLSSSAYDVINTLTLTRKHLIGCFSSGMHANGCEGNVDNVCKYSMTNPTAHS